MGFRYCPKCGLITVDQYQQNCSYCNFEYINSNDSLAFYINKSDELYNPDKTSIDYVSIDYARKALFDLEVSKNPLFDKQLYETRIAEKKAKDDAEFKQRVAKIKAEQRFTSTPNVPTCPTCHSTNVKKISFAKGYLHWRAFGLFSKTARSQFECSSCGYKW